MHERIFEILGFVGSVLLSLLLSLSPAWAQNYPNKPIRLIVAQAAGSATDNTARAIGQKLSEAFAQQVVIENRPGAGGLLGTELAAKSAPDGYTLQFATIATHGVIPALYKKLPYDPVKDFAPVILTTITPNVLIVHPSLPVRSVRDLIAFAKRRPGQLNFSSSGKGSAMHLAAELFQSMAGIASAHVPYRGTTPGMTALIAGEVEWMMPSLSTALPHIKTRRVRGLAVTSNKRAGELPELPTIADTLPGFDVVSWWGIVAPAGTPEAMVSRLNAETAKILAMPDTKKSLAAIGMHVAPPGSPEQFQTFIRSELAKWAKVVEAANIQLE
jgi:tripartite-type tricarboxylate transporter receptor subunit TctC